MELSTLFTRTVIGHRGAAAYAPENTLPSFELALEQGADCIEHDLHATKDGVLVCLHDRTLERTTNVREIFPDRGRAVEGHGPASRRWFVHDFTLSEVRQLDAGAWFDARFAGTRVPTFQEALECVRGRGALVAELKDPEMGGDAGTLRERLGRDGLLPHGAAGRRRDHGQPRSGATAGNQNSVKRIGLHQRLVVDRAPTACQSGVASGS
jgi:glycerophosphoryl diester phosphodiesterase